MILCDFSFVPAILVEFKAESRMGIRFTAYRPEEAHE